jgi:RHS repeat-associated protein
MRYRCNPLVLPPYDQNGNLTLDTDKSLSISYNFLNLPSQLGSLSILYDATGRKWRKAGPSSTTLYSNGIAYRDGKLEAIYLPDGFLSAEPRRCEQRSPDRAGYFPQRSPWGNTRFATSDFNQDQSISLHDDPATPESELEITLEAHYYPFGMGHLGPWYESVSPVNKHLSPALRWWPLGRGWGKELNDEEGVGLYDYGARWYDAAVGRWGQVDPRADKYMAWSAYNYVSNNPLLNIDPRGDTLRAVNPLSGERALNIVRSTFQEMGVFGYAMANLFGLESDGVTFSSINGGDFLNALDGLSQEGRALAVGYYMAIVGAETNVVEIVKRGEAISDYGQKALGFARTGAELDFQAGGGHTEQAFYSPGIVNRGADGAYAAVVMDSKAQVSYNDGKRSSLPGELLAHELIGHGLGGRFGNGVDASIQATNMFLKATGKRYYRTDHSPGIHSPGFNVNTARSAPKFLLDRLPFWKRY